MKAPLSFVLFLASAWLAANVRAWVLPKILRRGAVTPAKNVAKKFKLFQGQVVEDPVTKTPLKNSRSSSRQKNRFKTAATVDVRKRTKLQPWWMDLLAEAAAAIGIKPKDKNVASSDEETAGVSAGLEREPLASEGVWTAYIDLENTGLVYYFNEETAESQWRRPTSTFPAVKLPAKLNRIVQTKKQEYAADAMPTPVLRKEPRSVHSDNEEVGDMLLPYGGGSGLSALDAADTADASKLAIEGDWAAYWDKDGTSFIYYFNRRTGKSRWDPPTTTFPELALTNDMKIRAPTDDDSARELATQGDWTAYLDTDTCMFYYHNHRSGISQWEKPTDDFPQIRIPHKMRRRLMLFRQQHHQGSQKS